jgi:hypothetical protein
MAGLDTFINRIKDAYFDLDRDTARGQRFFEMSQAFTPGAIVPSPSQMYQMQQPVVGPGPQAGEGGQGAPLPQPAPAPQPSMLDLIGASR